MLKLNSYCSPKCEVVEMQIGKIILASETNTDSLGIQDASGEIGDFSWE